MVLQKYKKYVILDVEMGFFLQIAYINIVMTKILKSSRISNLLKPPP